MNKVFVIIVFILFYLPSNVTFGQRKHETTSSKHEEHAAFKKHSLSVEFGYTHIPDGYDKAPGDQVIWVPTFGLAYSYYFSHKWGASLVFNLETEDYLIELGNEHLKRDNVLIIAVVARYEILKNWGVFLGPGIEIEEHHNFAVVRFGTEYSIPLKKNWFLAPILTFDHKTEYTSLEFAVGIGKRF